MRSLNGLVRARAGLILSSSVMLALTGTSAAQISQHDDGSGVIELRSKKGYRSPGGAQLSRQPGVRAVMPSPGGAKRASQFDPHIREAAALYRIPEALVRAVIQVESNFDPRAVSPANAHGLMQMIPPTAERMMVTDIFDPRQNILGGTRYLRILANTFNGNLQLTIAAYNAGEGAVARYGGIPPYAETQNYVVKVMEAYQRYSTQ
jgi:soluble lytic murein transglycosylase-like protein